MLNEENIVRNLYLTFSITQTNPQNQIMEAENYLKHYMLDPQFCVHLIHIILNTQYPGQIRKSGLIFLKYMIVNHWTSDLPPESKNLILINFFSIIKCSHEFPKICINISSILVNCSFIQNGFPELTTIIKDGFTTDETSCFASLVLSNSLFRHINYQRKNDEIQNLFFLIPYTIQIISSTDSLILNSISFNNLTYLIKSSPIPFLQENISILFGKVNLLLSFQNTENYLYFSKQFMKFITIVIRNYCNVIDIQQVSPLFQTILTFFSQFKQERLLTSFSRLFNSLIFYEPLWELIKQQIDSFCISILLPFFVLDEEDIKDSIENPSMFLAKFQFEDVFDENPARAYIFETIQMKAKESQELCYSLYSLLVRSISANNSAQNILSIVFLFSACAKNFIKYFPQLCPNLVMLFSSFCKESNHLIKSAGLFGIKYFNMECLSIDVYYTVAMLIGDQCLLVQYYAATTFSELLENKTQKIVVMNACKDLLGNIVEMYFHLSSLFHDYEFIEMISNLLEFFGEIMTNIGVELSVEIYRTFLYYQNSFDGIEYSGVLMSSLIKFINLIKDPNEKDTIVTTLINEIFNSLQELKSGTLEIVLEFIEKLIVIAPLIHPNFWTLLNYVSSIMNNEVFILKGLKILENLVMKDPHTANVTENALQLLTLGINVLKIFSEFSNESSESIEFLARIFLFINYNDDIIIQAYNVLMPVVVKLVENPSQYNYTPSLMVSMLISHFDIFQQICGDNFWSIFGAWVENTSSVQLMTLIINTHEKFEQVDKKSRTSLIISAFKKAEVEDDIVRTAVEDEFELRLFDIHNTRVKFLEYLKTCDQQTMEEIQANINIDLEKFLTVGCPKTD